MALAGSGKVENDCAYETQPLEVHVLCKIESTQKDAEIYAEQWRIKQKSKRFRVYAKGKKKEKLPSWRRRGRLMSEE